MKKCRLTLDERTMHTDPMLIAITLTCRYRQQILALPHVLSSINSYMNYIEDKWTLESASERGLVKLMDRLGKLEWPGASDEFRQQRFMAAVKKAIYNARPQSLQWWMATYLRNHEFALPDIQKLAIEERCDYTTYRRVEILQWLFDQGKLISRASVFKVHGELSDLVVEWLHQHVPDIRLNIGVTYDSSRDFLKWVYDRRDKYEVDTLVDYMYKAMREGCGDRDFPWLHELSDIRLPRTFFNSFLHRHFFVNEIKWLYDHYPKQYFDDPRVPNVSLNVINWFLTEYEWKDENARIKWIEMCIEKAATHVDCAIDGLNIIKSLFKIRPETGTGNAMANAAGSGYFHIVKYLHDHNAVTTAEAMDSAAAGGHLDILEWLHEHRNEGCTTKAMDKAAGYNNLNVVQWLHTNRAEGCTTKAMDEALLHGHLEVVQWLHANRTEGCTPSIMDQLAAQGKIKMVQWLHANRSEGCTSEAMDKAAKHNRFDVVQFLHEYRSEGCTTKAMDNAAANWNVKMVQWLHANRQEGCTTDAMDSAARSGNVKMVEWLHANRQEGCTAAAMKEAAARGHLEAVKFLHEKRSEGSFVDALNAALGNNCVKVVKWLILNHTSSCSTEAFGLSIVLAARNDDINFAMWLLPKVSVDDVVRALGSAIRWRQMKTAQFLTTQCDLASLTEVLAHAADFRNFAYVDWALKYQIALGVIKLKCPFRR